jgi:hypothetical protein
LGCVLRAWPVGEETARLEDARFVVTKEENPIWLLVEVRYLAGGASERDGVGLRKLTAILDIEADRPKIAPVPAAVRDAVDGSPTGT